MRSIGIDLHKRSMTVCVIDRGTEKTFVQSFLCAETDSILEFFRKQRPFQAVVEASATYEWLWQLLDPIAERLALGHPKKIRIIAESVHKTDKMDARVLAWLLDHEAVPEAHRPTARQRDYQGLVRHRVFLVRQSTKLRVKIRGLLANWNIPCKGGITPEKARALVPQLPLADQFRVEELTLLLEAVETRLDSAEQRLRSFRKEGPESERKSREIIESVPGAGAVTSDVILSTLGDIGRFRSIKRATAYAGLVPGIRQSDKTRKELPITKEGSSLLRWVMVQAAWRAIRSSDYWSQCFEKLAHRRGRKKAAVAIARRLLGVIYTLLKTGRRYHEKMTPHTKAVLIGSRRRKRVKTSGRMAVRKPKASKE